MNQAKFTRKHSYLRRLRPENIIGYIIGCVNCDCGNNLWRYCGRGYMTSPGAGILTCKGCSEVFKEEIYENDRRIFNTGKKEKV